MESRAVREYRQQLVVIRRAIRTAAEAAFRDEYKIATEGGCSHEEATERAWQKREQVRIAMSANDMTQEFGPVVSS